jgi:hypothetical protein
MPCMGMPGVPPMTSSSSSSSSSPSPSSKQRPSTSAPHPLTRVSQIQFPRYRRINTIAALAAAAAIGGRQRRGNGINELHQSLALDFVHASR